LAYTAAIGLLVALVVVWLLQGSDWALARSTFQTVVILSIIPAVLAVVVLAVGARDVPVASDDRRRAPSLSLAGFDARFKGFLLIMLLFTLGNSSDAFLILRATERGLSVLGIMGMLVAFNLVYTLVSGPAGALSDRIGRRRIIVGGWLAYGIIYLGFALADEAWHVVVLYVLYGIYYGMTEGTARAMVADLVRPDQRGTAYGVFNAAVGLAAFPASLIAGVLWQGIGGWQGWGPRAPFFFGSLLALVAAVLLVFWFPTMDRED
jgi:MFS family permease